ncbi:MAG TPA: flagellar basal body rod protein FlgC [Terriglobales bacterium]|nr:flagellar basal body rod protein FlgC [Terriglobales bacterium]
MNLFGVMEISSSALRAERERAEVVAANMANAETTRTPEGGPYRRRHVVFRSNWLDFPTILGGRLGAPAQGIEVQEVVADGTPPLRRFEPSHPDADKDGYVAYPAINPAEEMVDLMGAVRAYQLNASAVTASKQMIQQSLEILR